MTETEPETHEPPKRTSARKAVFLFVIGVAISFAVSFLYARSRLLSAAENRYRDMITARGFNSAADFIPKCKPEENAAPVLEQAKSVYSSTSETRNAIDLRRSRSLPETEEELKILRAHFDNNTSAIELVRKAISLPCYTFEASDNPFDWKPPNVLGVSRFLKDITITRARLAEHDGETSVAVDSILLGFGMSRQMARLPSYLSIALSLLNLKNSMEIGEEILTGTRVSEQDLRKLIAYTDPKLYRANLSECFQIERMNVSNLARLARQNMPLWEFYHPLPATGWRRNSIVRMTAGFISAPFIAADALLLDDFYCSSSAITRMEPCQSRSMAASLDRKAESISSLRPLAKTYMQMSLRGISRHRERIDQLQVFRVAMGARLFAEKTGAAPENISKLVPGYLDDITDPYTGKPLHYERTSAGGFLVSSAGLDAVDDPTTGSDDIIWRQEKLP